MATRRAKLQIKPKVRIRSSAKAAVNESKEKAVASENDKFTPKSEDTIRSNVTAASVSTAKPKEVTKSDSNADVDNVNSDVNLSATNLKDDNENSVEVAPKSPTKIMEPSTQSRIVSRSRLPKAKPNIGEIERRGRIRSSYSESEDESTRQRNPSGPPSLQRVLRLDENANKGSPCLTALLNKEITAVEAPRNDKVILTDQASSRKRHRSAAHEVDDLKKQRKDFYRKGNKPPEKSKMRMLDLIFYNPSSSPMKNSEEVSVSISDQNNDVKQNSNTSRPEEVEIDDPVAIDEEIDGTNDEVDDENMMPVPQVKLGPDGNIIVDEETLVVKPLKVNPEAVNKNPVLYESTSMTTYSSFRRRQSQGKWNDLETSKFYKALCTVGTDFSLMAQLFPNRSRRELKKKFMKEDRLHKDLVTRAL
ncbi:BDP1 (predicted), partial [Pycnogonum litorale]